METYAATAEERGSTMSLSCPSMNDERWMTFLPSMDSDPEKWGEILAQVEHGRIYPVNIGRSDRHHDDC
jgi:hypothetical protein